MAIRRRRKRTYKRKGKKLEGYNYSIFIFPYLFFLVLIFSGLAGVFLFGAFSGGEIFRELFLFLAGISASMAIVFAVQRRRHKRLLNQFHTIARLREIDPTMFEHYVANLLGRHGFARAKVCGASGDRGVDIVAYKDGKKFAVQCKRYGSANKVSSPEMQQFVGSMKIYKAGRGLFVTTSTFTREARAIANEQKIVLIGEGELAIMIDQVFHAKK